jgi:hypothetical protein
MSGVSVKMLLAGMEGLFGGSSVPMSFIPGIRKRATAKPKGHAQIRKARKLERQNRRKARAARK